MSKLFAIELYHMGADFVGEAIVISARAGSWKFLLLRLRANVS